MTAPDQPIAITTRVLTQQKVGATLTQSMRVDVSTDEIRDRLTYKLTAYVLTDKIADDTFTGRTECSWPESTWQMFKSRHTNSWWFGWVVKRRPVRMHTETQTVKVAIARHLTYPEANLNLPELGRPVVFETASQIAPWLS